MNSSLDIRGKERIDVSLLFIISISYPNFLPQNNFSQGPTSSSTNSIRTDAVNELAGQHALKLDRSTHIYLQATIKPLPISCYSSDIKDVEIPETRLYKLFAALIII